MTERPAALHPAGRGARELAPALLVAFGLLLAACQRDAAPPAAPRLSGAAAGWNVLLVSVDTLRADRLGAYGYTVHPTSPRIDELLAGGVRFAAADAVRAETWPSLASVLTGLYPSGHGVVQNGYNFPDDLPTLPKLLAAAGYQTGAFLSNMCSANHQGWGALSCTRGIDGDVNAQSLEWAGRLDRTRPFLLWVHYFGAHSPYYNGGAFAAELGVPGYRGPVAANKGALNRIMSEPIPLGSEDIAQLDALYDAAVMGSDRTVAALLDGLRAAGLLERTLIVFLADHGEDLYRHHGYIYHACSVYESGLHVPLGFVAPGLIPAGASNSSPVELIDVTPTVLELLGVEPPTDLHGRSLVPLLERPAAPSGRSATFSEYGASRIHTARLDGWKLVVNPDHEAPLCFDGAPPGLYPIAPVELYDLTRDPGETRNLAAEQPQRVEALADLLRRRFAGLSSRVAPQEVPEDLKRELRALGYVAN